MMEPVARLPWIVKIAVAFTFFNSFDQILMLQLGSRPLKYEAPILWAAQRVCCSPHRSEFGL
jgi:hypothetical protein